MSRSPAIALSLRLALVSALALPVLVPLPARGQGDDMERAREAYSRGQTLFDAGDHAGALTAFVESLDAFPHFRTIFNIALCHEKLGDVAAAVAMYERYVEWPSDVPNREEVRAKAAELRALLPSEPEPEPAPAPPPGGSAPPPPPAPPPVTAEPGRDLRLPGWVADGGGAAGLVVDARRDVPFGAYAQRHVPVSLAHTGDAAARAAVRQAEAVASADLILQAAGELASASGRAVADPGDGLQLAAGSVGLGWAEGSRGTEVHWIETDAKGRVARYRVRSATFACWQGFARSIPGGNILTDFPIIEQSFGLSYAGSDR